MSIYMQLLIRTHKSDMSISEYQTDVPFCQHWVLCLCQVSLCSTKSGYMITSFAIGATPFLWGLSCKAKDSGG